MVSTLLGVAGGALATGAGALLRTRIGVRTAARLIYAELARGCTAVAFFRRHGQWADPLPARTAWDANSAVLARRRGSATFEAVLRGYEALEFLPFDQEALPEREREPLLRAAVLDLVAAIDAIGKVAGIPRRRIEAVTSRLRNARRVSDSGALSVAGTVPTYLQERLTEQIHPSLVLSRSLFRRTVWVSVGSSTASSARARCIVFDAGASDKLRGHPVARATGDAPVGDAAIDETFDGLVAAATFLKEVFGRDHLIPGKPFAAVAHYGTNYNNAFMAGEVLFLGDGDDRFFSRFTGTDVIGAEITKALPELWHMTATGQTGALRSSFRDVLGVLIAQYARNESVQDADWLLGAGLLAPGVNGVALRSLADPGTAYDDPDFGKDPQPAVMGDYVYSGAPFGGIHVNSGIPNRAFFLLANQLGGHAWERAGRIWWDVITGSRLDAALQFTDFARLTAAAALARYGEGEELAAVQTAWRGVEVPT